MNITFYELTRALAMHAVILTGGSEEDLERAVRIAIGQTPNPQECSHTWRDIPKGVTPQAVCIRCNSILTMGR